MIALEPSEAARVLGMFGNPDTVSVVNTRPVQPVDVICGDIAYPDLELLFDKIRSLSRESYFVPATDKALELGNPILANIVLIGAVSGAGLLPLSRDSLEKAVADYMLPEKVPINTTAFLSGIDMVKD